MSKEKKFECIEKCGNKVWHANSRCVRCSMVKRHKEGVFDKVKWKEGKKWSKKSKEKMSENHAGGVPIGTKRPDMKGNKNYFHTHIYKGKDNASFGRVFTEDAVMKRVLKEQKHISTKMNLVKYGYYIYDWQERNNVPVWRKAEYIRRISFGLNVPFDWHHVNKTDVVAIQREIHKSFPHSLKKGNAKQLEGVLG